MGGLLGGVGFIGVGRFRIFGGGGGGFIGVGRFRIFGGARFSIFGGQGGAKFPAGT